MVHGNENLSLTNSLLKKTKNSPLPHWKKKTSKEQKLFGEFLEGGRYDSLKNVV